MKFVFRPLMEKNLGLVMSWLKEPHVKEFWDDGDNWEEIYKQYILKISSDVVKQFVVYLDNEPVGFIQFYWAAKVGVGWWKDYPDDVIGIDLYIGDLNYIGNGFGTNMIKAFIKFLQSNYKFSKIITDPSPDNKRAIRCYEKAGFVNQGQIVTPDGDALLMEYELDDKAT
ncbi:MAG: hypothetical protein A2381_12475 [Bdellovibrionales bacterium RIFOXYB1_FULL_37_110]|nr:MAG: hypothetical protein A2417_14475 [Bdellovibrionales bacterium RIFOXYC1_FULL_37_79]OFZ57547.1 MAG: hypothetical protein A2381_12475 [Bdellovibrionales bacterium RIFOXYB1_FULL_37_110]